MLPVAPVDSSGHVTGASHTGSLGPPPSAPPQGADPWGPDAIDITGMTVGEALNVFEQYRLDKVKSEIAAGSYLTEQKLEFVTDRLAELLRREGKNKKASA